MRRLTIRTRLTLVYGGLFLVAGVILLGVTYVLGAARLVDDRPPAATPRATPAVHEDEAPKSGAPDPGLPQLVRDARLKALRDVLSQGGIALGMVGVAAIGVGWLVAGRLLQPLHRITGTAR